MSKRRTRRTTDWQRAAAEALGEGTAGAGCTTGLAPTPLRASAFGPR